MRNGLVLRGIIYKRSVTIKLFRVSNGDMHLNTYTYPQGFGVGVGVRVGVAGVVATSPESGVGVALKAAEMANPGRLDC